MATIEGLEHRVVRLESSNYDVLNLKKKFALCFTNILVSIETKIKEIKR